MTANDQRALIAGVKAAALNTVPLNEYPQLDCYKAACRDGAFIAGQSASVAFVQGWNSITSLHTEEA